MNRILTIWRLDHQYINPQWFQQCEFRTPYWQPDHEGLLIKDDIGFSANQRFVTPECSQGLMPLYDDGHQLVINADVYLTNRDQLCRRLSTQELISDVQLILLAYLKWGRRCTDYLAGQFAFVIWDVKQQQLFAAVDQFANIPLFYYYQPGRLFICSNEYSPFKTLCSNLSINKKLFVNFAFDNFLENATGFTEVLKVRPGHQLWIHNHRLRESCYWRLKDHQKHLKITSREEGYAAFREQFAEAVKAALRSPYGICSQISGGLDSSAVTAQAAALLDQPLYAITAVPNNLSGPSYRSHWTYHEMPLVQAILDRCPSIRHFAYTALPETDMFEKLNVFYPYIDQPIRNVMNFDWLLGSNDYALAHDCRVLLHGSNGNNSISWEGETMRDHLVNIRHTVKTFLKPQRLFAGFFDNLNSILLHSQQGKEILRKRGHALNLHYHLLSGRLTAPLKSASYPIQLYYGVRKIDPTQHLDLILFCYALPSWMYCKGRQVLEKRLLVREGLVSLLPDSVRMNPYRGEQAADWYLQYNVHRANWQRQLEELSEGSSSLLWKCYDQRKIVELLQTYLQFTEPPNHMMTNQICHSLLRCVSAAAYLQNL